MLVEMVRQIIQHVEHHSEFIVELLDRLDVSMIADSKGCKLDKRSQRAITVEETTNPEEDQKVEKVLKRGFQYRGLIIRPEEVVIKRFKPSATAPASGTTPAPDIAGVVRR
jgi:molecular chaperone GrpE (heat shock protein)